MSHKGVRMLIEATAKSLGDDVQFTYARTSDFNVMRDKRYPFITLDPLRATPSFSVDNVFNFSKLWVASMAFYELDKESSTGDEYALILDLTDNLVDRFINKLNLYNDNILVLTSISQEPFIKATADILTGHLLTLTIQVPDDFDYCNEC